jgi:DNA repair protein RecO (recombination protein O)
MALHHTNGINLRISDFSDADRYVSVLTRDRGLIEVFARGARRTKSPLLRATEIFSLSAYVLFEKNDRFSVNTASVIEGFAGLQKDLTRLTCAAHLAEVWMTVAQPGEPQPELYELAAYTLHALAEQLNDPLLIVRACETRVLALSGYAPALDVCSVCGCTLAGAERLRFSFPLCGPVCERAACLRADSTHRYGGRTALQLSRGTRKALAYFMQAPVSRLFGFKLTPEIAEELHAFLPQYLQDRLEHSFRKLDFLTKL